MDGRTRDIESWKRKKRKELKQKGRVEKIRRPGNGRKARSGLLSAENGDVGADVDAARGDSDWRQGFFGERSERNWKMRRRGLTLAASGTINVCARLQTCPLCPPFRSSSRLGRCWQVSREYWQGGRSWWLKFDDSNSRFNSVFNWATMNHRSLFARGFALQILGRPSLPPLSTWESILAADYEDIRAWFLPRIKRYLIRIRMEFINLDLSADNCEPTFSSLSPPQPTRF